MPASGDKPLVFLYTVKRDERNHDRCGPDILLILRIISVGPVLTDLEPSGAAEHNIYNTDVSGKDGSPLPYSMV